jgi:predicted HTH domain antitoxin
MPRGVKTDNQKIADIVASYALTNSYNKTSKEVGVSSNTVKNIINKQKKENAEEFAKVCKEKKEEFVDKASRLIDKAMDKLDKELNKDDIPINNLTTVIGTLYDKRALAKGEATDNNKLEVNIKVIE